jgi:uncharacterized protein YjiS (DUF1127 family)
LEVSIMSNQQGASRKQPPSNTFLHSPVRFICETVINPVRRRAHGRGGIRELARLDDHLLRDIGLTRAQVLAAAFGPAGTDRHFAADSVLARSLGPGNVVPLKCPASTERVEASAATPLVRRAARG